MKVAKISVVLLSALFSIAVFAAPLGEVSSENDKIFNGENYMVVKGNRLSRTIIRGLKR